VKVKRYALTSAPISSGGQNRLEWGQSGFDELGITSGGLHLVMQ
jgi:hypothetical protein